MSFAPIQLLQTSVPFVWAGFDYSDDRNMSWCLYKGAVNTLPDMAFFAKGCTLIHEAEATSYTNRGETGAAPEWFTSNLLSQVTHVTSTQLKNMHASPVLVVDAPASDKFISPRLMTVIYNFGTLAYLGSGNTNVVCNGNNVFQIGTSLHIGSSTKIQYTVLSVMSITAGLPLYLTNTVGELTNGDGDVTIIIDYDIKQLPV